MDRFQSTIEIDAPASVCYEKWHHFDKFPQFMSNVKSVESLGGKRWHWVVNGPLGVDVEWDAEIDGDEQSRLVSWHTVGDSGQSPTVEAQGAVRFQEITPGQTEVTCTIQYKAPAGNVGEVVANLIKNPHKMVDEDLRNFKHLVEGTNIPAEKAHSGKTLHPDSFVVPEQGGGKPGENIAEGTAAAASGGLAMAEFDENANTGYEGPYGLDNDLTDAVILGEEETYLEEAQELQALQQEEEPYLADEGALHSEDLRDMQAFESNPDEQDVFTESLDVEEEDLENYTQDLDEEINAGLGPREEISIERREQARREV